MESEKKSDLERKITIAKLMLHGNSCRNCLHTIVRGTTQICSLTGAAIHDPFLSCCELWSGADARGVRASASDTALE